MSERIALVVDDSKSARFALRKYLEGHAFRVDTADSARAAYAWLQDQRPDLIFLDHVMPGEDGFTALQHIKDDPQTADIPVVICSSNEGGTFVAEARSRGAAEVLQKPPNPDQLQRVLKQIEALAVPPAPPTPPAPPAVEAPPSPVPDTTDTQAASPPAPPPAAAPVHAAPPAPSTAAATATAATAPSPAPSGAAAGDLGDVRESLDLLRADLTTASEDSAQITQALEARASAIETRLGAIEQRLGSDLANARKHFEREIESLRRHGDQAIEALRTQHEAALTALRNEQRAALDALQQQREREQASQRQQFDTELRAVHEQFRDELARAAQSARAQALQDMRARLLAALGD